MKIFGEPLKAVMDAQAQTYPDLDVPYFVDLMCRNILLNGLDREIREKQKVESFF